MFKGIPDEAGRLCDGETSKSIKYWNAVTWGYYLYRLSEFTSAVMRATPFAYLTQFIWIRPISFLYTSTVNMHSVVSLKYVVSQILEPFWYNASKAV